MSPINITYHPETMRGKFKGSIFLCVFFFLKDFFFMNHYLNLTYFLNCADFRNGHLQAHTQQHFRDVKS